MPIKRWWWWCWKWVSKSGIWHRTKPCPAAVAVFAIILFCVPPEALINKPLPSPRACPPRIRSPYYATALLKARCVSLFAVFDAFHVNSDSSLRGKLGEGRGSALPGEPILSPIPPCLFSRAHQGEDSTTRAQLGQWSDPERHSCCLEVLKTKTHHHKKYGKKQHKQMSTNKWSRQQFASRPPSSNRRG